MAERLGKVTVVIRSVETLASADGAPASVYGGDVSAALADGETAGVSRMRVIDGKDARDVTFQ